MAQTTETSSPGTPSAGWPSQPAQVLSPAVGQEVILSRSGLGDLIAALRRQEYQVVGPVRDNGVIALGPITAADQLATHVSDWQNPGEYRLQESDLDSYSQYVVGPDSAKRYVFPPVMRLFRMRVQDGQFKFEAGPPDPPKLALLLIRPCDLAALLVMDRVFSAVHRCETDLYFRRARQQMCIVVLNCTRPGQNCFCESMGTGPAASSGFDLALTELSDGFLMKVGSALGVRLVAELHTRLPLPAEVELAKLRLELARQRMGRRLDAAQAAESLQNAIEHPHWDQVAKRCLACGNCTMVCPTCFCSGVSDSNDLCDGSVSRTRSWDSCFTYQFTYTTAGPVRSSVRARYRHWLRHKLCTFREQFACSGCVGCGRCITWCPAGIDLTREAAAVAGRDSAQPSQAAAGLRS